jgi:hypothetical protein
MPLKLIDFAGRLFSATVGKKMIRGIFSATVGKKMISVNTRH